MPGAKTAKELRKQAEAAGIEDWQSMDRDELTAALAEAEGEEPEEDEGEEETEEDEEESEEEAEDEEEEEDEEPPARPAKRTAAKKAPAKKAVAARPANKKTTTRPASKPTAKKAAPAKAKVTTAKAKETDEPEGPNPFRSGTNLHLMVEELMKGGKRSAMVTRLSRKIDLNPRSRAGKDWDKDEEIDYRLVRACQVLANEHNFTLEKDGRGKDQKVKAIPPE